METITDFNLLYFIRDTYPVSFIVIVLATFGYLMGTVGFRWHIKTLQNIEIRTLQRILERLH